MTPTPRDRPHQVDPDDPGGAAYRAAAVDHMAEARRLLVQAHDEVVTGELNARRGNAPQLAADADVLSRAIDAECFALDAAVMRHRAR